MSDALTRRQRIIAEFKRRLETILLSDGFQTDAGTALSVGAIPKFGKDDPKEALALLPGDDDPTMTAEKIRIDLPLEIQALAACDLADPWMAAEAILADIKKAIETPDRQLAGAITWSTFMRGATKPAPREEGNDAVGISITYVIPYTETWGDP